MKHFFIFLLVIFVWSCQKNGSVAKKDKTESNKPYVFVLGVAQDAGYPQINCEKECCQRVYKNPQNARSVVSLALVDPISNTNWIFDATPDFPKQLKMLSDEINKPGVLPNGIFLTHAHIGHYTGLMYLGREAMNAKNVPVYAMPRMKHFLENNGPWSQLVSLKNIELRSLQTDSVQELTPNINVTPLLVPHRDEYSETVGFLIKVGAKKLLFIPDIDKWNRWDSDILDYIKQVDYAFLDATFFKNGEIVGRPMSEIPHPFVEESMKLFKNLSKKDKNKVYFIHFNHTNPLLIDGSSAQKEVEKKGFNVAKQGMKIAL
ncbi:MAG: MBL fold metallo-hydrolase [Lutibacter sp.]